MSEAVDELNKRDLAGMLPELESPHLRFADERVLEEPFMFALGWRKDKKRSGFWTREGRHFYDSSNWRPYWKFKDALMLASIHLGVIAMVCSIDDYADGGDVFIPKTNHECWAEIRAGGRLYRGVGRSIERAINTATIRGVLEMAEPEPKLSWLSRFRRQLQKPSDA